MRKHKEMLWSEHLFPSYKKKSSYNFPVSFNHHPLKSWHQQIMKTLIKHSSSNSTLGSGSSLPKRKTTSLHAGGEEKPEIWQVCCLYPAGWNVTDWQGNFSMHLLFTLATSYSRTGTTWRANQYFPKQKHTTRCCTSLSPAPSPTMQMGQNIDN